MKNLLLFLIILLTLSCAKETIGPNGNDSNGRTRIYGQVVETFYTPEILFSVKGLEGVNIKVGNQVVTQTNAEGKFNFYLNEHGVYTIYAEKNHYDSDSEQVNTITGDNLERNFYLRRENEGPHGWNAFPMTITGARLSITNEGLSLFSLGYNQIYATKTFKLANNHHYKFLAKIKKDVMTQRVYFAVQPQIDDYDWIYQSWQVDNWRDCIIDYFINDTTIIDTIYVDNDPLYIYPDSVVVVLKIGAELGSFSPTGYFKDIKVIKE